jgi:O-acetylhomoserine (thiol)-lyase
MSLVEAGDRASDYRFDTLKVRGAYNPTEHNNAFSVPIYQTTSFEMGDTARGERLFRQEELGFLYSRVGNPTIDVFERRVAELDGASAAVALASGMAAVSYSVLNLADSGERIVASPYLYGGSYDLFKSILPRYGITVDIATSLDPRAFQALIGSATKAVFIESIANPKGYVADIEAFAQLAHDNGLPLIVDNTFATPYLIQPFKHGADVVVYSATKGLSGHGNIVAGLILESGKFNYGSGRFAQFTDKAFTLRDRDERHRSFLEVFPETPFTARVRLSLLNYLGATLSPFNAYLALLGLETLSERIEKQLANVRAVIAYLQQSEHVAWIDYAELPDSPNHDLAARYAPRGPGAIFAFGFKGTLEQQERFIDSTRLFSYQVNVGDARSLIVNNAKTTHSELTLEEQRASGLPPETIRLSLGLEDPRDLIADLDQAFRAVFDTATADAGVVASTAALSPVGNVDRATSSTTDDSTVVPQAP